VFRRFSFPLRILPYAIVLAVGALVAFDPAKILSQARDRIFDGYQRLSPRVYVDPASVGFPGVLYVDIDDSSLAKLGQWPWPRTLLATLIERLDEAGAKVIACQMTMDLFGWEPKDLIDGVTLGGAASYMEEALHSKVNLFV